MITEEKKILLRLEALVRFGKDDPTEVHIDFESLVMVLGQFGFILRPARFEKKLEELLNKTLVGKLKIAQPQLAKHIVATAIYEVAVAMDMSRDPLIRQQAATKPRDILNP